MSNIRTKILGLSAMATAFVGVSFGQTFVYCQAGTAAGGPAAVSNIGTQVNPSLRAESQTEMIAAYQFYCAVSASGTSFVAPVGPPAPAPTTGTLYVTTNLPITSKAIGTFPQSNEATLITNGSSTAVAAGGVITLMNGTATPGAVSGNQVSFTLPAMAIPVFPATQTFEVTNIRVNASSAGAPQVTESALLSYVQTTTTQGLITANLALPMANGPGYILKSLGPPTLVLGGTTPASFAVCTGNPLPFFGAAAANFQLSINQLIPDTFLGIGNAAATLPGSEAGQYVNTASGAGVANADIINVVIGNLPSSATVYVPQNLGPFGTTAAPINNFSLSIANSTVSSATGAPANSVAFTPSGGIVTIPYTVSVVGGGDQTIPAAGNGLGGALTVGVVVSFAANSATAQGPITANYGYAPAVAALTGPASAVPQFVASSFTPANAQAIVNCQTTLLFPFVTNQVGFDTGIAISNTSTDNLGFGGKSFAAAQSGTCTLYFYGPTAPTPASVADPQGSLASGNVHAFQLSSVAAGYQGYMIAVCPFQYAHAFAFVTYGLTTSNGVAEGYLAPVLGSRGSTTYGDAVTTF